MAMVLDAQLQQAGLFKKVAESMKDLCKEVNFDCSERGMTSTEHGQLARGAGVTDAA